MRLDSNGLRLHSRHLYSQARQQKTVGEQLSMVQIQALGDMQNTSFITFSGVCSRSAA